MAIAPTMYDMAEAAARLRHDAETLRGAPGSTSAASWLRVAAWLEERSGARPAPPSLPRSRSDRQLPRWIRGAWRRLEDYRRLGPRRF